MNVIFWFLQFLLALHTAVGAIWKSSKSEHVMRSIGAIPHGVSVGLTLPELLCAIALVAPAFFGGVHLTSGAGSVEPVVYWVLVAAVSAFVAYGRLMLEIRRSEFA